MDTKNGNDVIKGTSVNKLYSVVFPTPLNTNVSSDCNDEKSQFPHLGFSFQIGLEHLKQSKVVASQGQISQLLLNNLYFYFPKV